MALVTMKLKTVCESLVDNKPHGFNELNNTIYEARQKIFDFYYPFWTDKDSLAKLEKTNKPLYDELMSDYETPVSHRIITLAQWIQESFERDFVYHFYNCELGQETYGLWKLSLRNKLNEIMPYYNKMYEMQYLLIDPLKEWESWKEGNHKGHSDTTQSGKVANISKQDEDDTTWNETLFSNTPQGNLTDVRNGNYLTTYQRNNIGGKSGQRTSTTDYSGNPRSDTETNGNYDEHQYGHNKSPMELMQQYKDTFSNIDQQIYDECNDLFLQLWYLD